MNHRVAGCFAIVLCVTAGIMVTPADAARERPTERVSPAPECNPNAVVWRTPAPPASPQAGDVWVNAKDGMEMVYVASGEFTLGTSDAQIDAWLKEHPADKREEFKNEQPQCRVNLRDYWIGRTEVTNAQYEHFVQATGHDAPDYWKGGRVPSGLENFPIVFVSWQDARAYCEWAGGRLPSELQWEKAARGTDGRVFPWGNEWDAKRCRNFEVIMGKRYLDPEEWSSDLEHWMFSHDSLREGPAQVGSYPTGRSPYGCLDMAGNVSEWCADWYEGGAYKRYANGDLAPPASGTEKVRRGGSWPHAFPPGVFGCACREDVPDDRSELTGLRCARGPA